MWLVQCRFFYLIYIEQVEFQYMYWPLHNVFVKNHKTDTRNIVRFHNKIIQIDVVIFIIRQQHQWKKTDFQYFIKSKLLSSQLSKSCLPRPKSLRHYDNRNNNVELEATTQQKAVLHRITDVCSRIEALSVLLFRNRWRGRQQMWGSVGIYRIFSGSKEERLLTS